MKVTGPLFKWFGSKWLSSKLLPPPECDLIVEPFAGGAGYALRHCEHQVQLWDSNEQLQDLWTWFIYGATEALIREIPINIPEGTFIGSLGLSRGQELLLKHWQRTNNVGECWTISPWGNKPGQWTANTRARVAEEHAAVRHWKLCKPTYTQVATYLIDPPYQYNYQYRSAAIDYAALAEQAQSVPIGSQVIVCEARCPKTDAAPTWLPFQDFASRITSRRKQGEHTHSRELIWVCGGSSGAA